MTDFIYAFCAVATDQSVGNKYGAKLDIVGGALSFSTGHGMPCYPAGTTITRNGVLITASAAPTAHAVSAVVKAPTYAALVEFSGSGPYPILNSMGLTTDEINADKSKISIVVGPRATYESYIRTYAQSLGYVVA